MSEARKKQQWVIVGLIGSVLVFVIIVLGQVMNSRKAGFQTTGGPNSMDATIIADRTSNVSPETTWVRQSKEDIDRLSKTVTELSDTVKMMVETQKTELAEMRSEMESGILQQQAAIVALQEGRGGTGQSLPDGSVVGQDGTNYGQEFVGGRNTRTQIDGRAQGATPASAGGATGGLGSRFGVDFSLSPLPDPAVAEVSETSRNVRDLKSYIPAGSYAPAVIISGVDASTGVVSRDNPVPVLVRVTGPAVTAAGGTGTARRINITGCTVLGSAIGDLSSERVYVRLTTLTCLGKGDQIIETPVAGLVAGSGKAGVRGHVVSREGNLTSNAAIAGALGGFAEALSSASSIATSNAGAETVNSVLQGAGVGVAGGAAGNAADMLAEYYIKRAEQYQPVVSLYAGTDVEVIFMEGVSLK